MQGSGEERKTDIGAPVENSEALSPRVAEQLLQRALREGATEIEELRQQLAAAQAETARVKSQWLAAQKAVPSTPPNVQRETELVQAHSQLRRVQCELTMERQTRDSEAGVAAERIASLEHELEALVSASKGSKARGWKITTAGLAACLVAGGFMVSPHLPLAHSASVPAVTAGESTTAGNPESAPARSGSPARSTGAPAAARSGDFTASLSRLNHALYAVPGRSPQEVLKAAQLAHANSDKPVCAFEWKDSGPALLFGKGGASSESISTTLTRCADALEQGEKH